MELSAQNKNKSNRKRKKSNRLLQKLFSPPPTTTSSNSVVTHLEEEEAAAAEEKTRGRTSSFVHLGENIAFHCTGNEHCRLRTSSNKALLYDVDQLFFVKAYEFKDLALTVRLEHAHADIGAHPNIIPLLGCFRYAESRFISFKFPFIKGVDLVDYVLNYTGHIPASMCKYITRSCLEALEYIHSRGYIHGDMKADNVMICSTTGQVYLCDLEFAVQFTPNQYMVKSSGSHFFAAPEILSEQRCIGPEVDIWALGVIAYTCVYKRFPCNTTITLVAMDRIIDNIWHYPHDIRKTSHLFRNFTNQCLAYDPCHRSTATQLLADPWLKSGVSPVCTSLSLDAYLTHDSAYPNIATTAYSQST
jgi:serine/threonine protein kinase